RVNHCLAGDEISLISHQRLQHTRLAVGGHDKVNVLRRSKFLGKQGKSLFQSFGTGLPGTKGAQGIAPFLADLPEEIQTAFHCWLRWRVLLKPTIRQVKMNGCAVDSLQKRVVQVSCNSLPLFEPFLKPRLHLPEDLVNSGLIKHPYDDYRCQPTGNLEPRSLPERRINRDRDRGF